jgi:hypothetical protein
MRTKIFLALLIVGGTAHASEWVSLGKTDDGTEAFVDVSSIRVTGAIRRAWMKTVMPPQTAKGEGSDGKEKWMSSIVNRFAFNCADETSRYEATTYQFDDGTNNRADARSYPSTWQAVTPDTVWEAEMRSVCRYKPH